jgi:AcrR family transcriptional regulator
MTRRQAVAPTRPRDRLLATATRRFGEDGIRAVSVDSIIAEADVALMTLYRQFGGKDKLVAAALEHGSARLRRWLVERLDRCGDDPDARFHGLWDALEEWVAAEESRGSVVARAATELRGKPDRTAAHEAIAAHRMTMSRLLEDLAERAGAADPPALAAQLHVLVESLLAERPADTASIRALASAALAASRPPQ